MVSVKGPDLPGEDPDPIPNIGPDEDPDPIPDICPDKDPDPIPDVGPDLDPARIKGIVQKTDLVVKVISFTLILENPIFFTNQGARRNLGDKGTLKIVFNRKYHGSKKPLL